MPRPRKAAHLVHYRGTYHAYLDRDRRRVPLNTTDETEALAQLAQLVQVHRSRPAPGHPGEKTLAQYADAVEAGAKSRQTPKTVYELGLNLIRVVSWLENTDVFYAGDVTTSIVERYVAHRRDGEDGVSAARVNRELDSLRRLLRHAEGEGALPEGYAARTVKKLREPRPVPHERGLTKPEITRFLKAVDKRYAPMMRAMLGCGLRDEELRHLEAGDVNEVGGTVTVTPKPGWTTKGYRYRTVPISRETSKALLAFLASKPTLNMDKKRVWKVIQAACKKAKVKPSFSLHDLRKAWASHLFAKLGPSALQSISKWLGHADVLTTMRYLRVVDAELPRRAALPF